MRKAGAIAISVAAMCAPAAAGGAAGGPNDIPTFFVEFDFRASKFAGKIDSGTARCKRDRRIVLYRKKRGEKNRIASDKSNNKGKFKIGLRNPRRGRYFVAAKKSSYENNDGNRITCLPEKSAKVELG